MEPGPAAQEKPRGDSSGRQVAEERYRRAVERFKETRGALDDASGRAMAASRAAESLGDPAAQTRAKGMMKAATGNEAKLTPAERDAVAGGEI